MDTMSVGFVLFAKGYGLILNHPVADGRVHRVKTEDHRHKANGTYQFWGDHGWVQNWATQDKVALWQANGAEKPTVIHKPVRDDPRKRWETARKQAQTLLAECVQGTHAYLARKGFPRLTGFVHTSGDLLIPMRDIQDYSVVNGVQRISPDGTKKFLLGMKAKGSVFRIGSKGPTWICEGFATGKSIEAVLRDLRQPARVLVTFSAGNLTHCAGMVKPPAFVFADNDSNDAGLNAALATGLPFTIWDQIGDANDMMLATSLQTVASLIREAQDQAAGY
jgi:putative DNA primase/helicase